MLDKATKAVAHLITETKEAFVGVIYFAFRPSDLLLLICCNKLNTWSQNPSHNLITNMFH